MKLEGVIFDFDGVVVDTEPLHYQAFADMLEPLDFPFTWEMYQELYMGMDDREAFDTVYARNGQVLTAAERTALIEQKAHQFPALAAAADLAPFPGVEALIREVSGTLPLGLCSGALEVDIQPLLARFDLQDCFDQLVTAEQVKRSKPDPESYRLTLERLGLTNPAAVIAIEDTPAGIRSAKGAGCRVLAVTNSHVPTTLLRADWVVPGLQGVNIEALQERLNDA
ncbi:MAG: beta-phosphoglucomutase [Candidatus Omnitrophota bacterium]|jgi:beta-phosphoglucomutase